MGGDGSARFLPQLRHCSPATGQGPPPWTCLPRAPARASRVLSPFLMIALPLHPDRTCPAGGSRHLRPLAMIRLSCVAQNYAWGKPADESMVAALLVRVGSRGARGAWVR